MIRGKYEVYSGRPHLSDDRQGRQTILFPKAIDDYIEEENPVQFIDAFVDNLDLEGLGFKHTKLNINSHLKLTPFSHLKLTPPRKDIAPPSWIL